jgi:hypothetical protein
MRTAWIRASLLLVTLLLLTTSVFAQGQNSKSPSPYRWQCDSCVSKVIQLPSSSTPVEMQDLANMFRTIIELRILSQDPSQHTISVTCTPEELAIVDTLVAVLEDLRSAGDQRRSILIHEPQNPPPADGLPQGSRKPRPQPELASSVIKAFYLPNLSLTQMQTLTNTVRITAEIAMIQQLPSAHVVVVRGTSEQVAQADSLLKE